jgi:NADH-quinone oxidoreductase subunit M
MGILSVIVLAPMVAALMLLLIPDRSRGLVRLISVLGAGVSLVGSILVAFRYDLAVNGVQMAEKLPLIPRLGIHWHLGVDGWGVSLLLLTSIIIFAGCFATWNLQDRSKEFYIMLLVLVTGVFGVFVSLDLLVFFLFYEIAVLPMYLLIGIWGSSNTVPSGGLFKRAMQSFQVGSKSYSAMKLTLMLLLGSALILAGLLAMVHHAGSWNLLDMETANFPRELQIWAFPALWIGFGSLAGVFPFHTWSPDGHASAPTAVSMLHAGVLMKLGAFGIIRVGMVCLPEGAEFWAFAVGTVAVINIVWGALSAFGQSDLKYVIAYSSVSHMGVVMLGAATLGVNGLNGAIFQMFAHGVMTGLMFALVGIIYHRAHSREVFQMGGFAERMPWVAVFFTIAALSSLGMPGTSGFAAELLVFLGAWEAHWWWAVPALLGAVVTAYYILRVAKAIFWGQHTASDYPDLQDLKGTEWVAPIILAGSILVFGFAPELLLQFIDHTTVNFVDSIQAALSTGGTP